MKTVLFLINPLPSHYNGFFRLADLLRHHNYQVVFTGTAYLRDHIETQGFDFVELDYLIEYYIVNRQSSLADFKKTIQGKAFGRQRYREFLGKVRSVEQVLADVQPDYVLVDEHLNYYYYLIQHLVPKVYFLHIKPPTRRAPGLPPMTDPTPMQNTLLDRFSAWMSWERYLMRRSIGRWMRAGVFLGKNDLYFVGHWGRKHGVDKRQLEKRDNALYDIVRGVTSIYMTPQAFEYPWFRPAANEQFLCRPYQRRDVSDNAKFWQQIEPAMRSNDKLILVALGTLSADQADVALGFLRKVVAAVRPLTGIQVVIANKLLASELNLDLPAHVHLFSFVPQPELLPHCDLMLTHGGIGSVTECLAAGVPMLVYPLNLTSDQVGNVGRILYHRLGLAGDLRQADEAVIRQQIQTLLINRVLYNARVRAMQDRIESDTPSQERAVLSLFGLTVTETVAV
ncbi:glycosyltransferase family 1 protein [Spirosoma taeanense]|uniref:Glycosyltransferase family 1 protein n=1 Tax=Spirosoma taeanense TaxID=2735870 RepID=A0A6M5YCW1_9BACT|nr:glycosyltransferase [Spirosoma taeanense]QJW91071.1 glycosyltransferase family 1 protein [Spirosoma taeanense]